MAMDKNNANATGNYCASTLIPALLPSVVID
ncbi:hypothetical protein SAMN06296010_1493 [Agreia pratensis]|uniref:Uncharacterized protein n=1 Tax=Agreia pratensis TaxID=150121 RepID=A0A1X7JLS6_9MICO|nr:hypothetical protein SAMN06296010_1493 [Agreia pratensis]